MNHLQGRVVALFLPLLFSFTVTFALGHDGHDHNNLDDMVRAAQRFLDVLGPELRTKAIFSFDGKERKKWHFVPKDRAGVSLKEMNLVQRQAAHELLRTPLSSKGYLKATAVMSLEQVLRELGKDQPGIERIRDQEKYWFAIFGTPAHDNSWGWRVEGHHLSLNFSAVTGTLVAPTPAFFGANPAEVRSGPRAGLRVLAAEEDLARAIMASLTDTQTKQAIIAVEAPRDVITGPGQAIDLGKPIGLPAAQMSKQQQSLLWRLIEEYAHNLRREIADGELVDFRANGDEIHFAWAGSVQRGRGHYYRIHGRTFIIEYDNTQNDANHIHTVWHSLNNDFGLDALRRHYTESPHEK